MHRSICHWIRICLAALAAGGACSTEQTQPDAGNACASPAGAGTAGGGCGYFGKFATEVMPSCPKDSGLNYCSQIVLTLASCDAANPPLTLTLQNLIWTPTLPTYSVGGVRYDVPILPLDAQIGSSHATSGTATVENADDWGVQGAFDVVVDGTRRQGRFDARSCPVAADICPRLAQGCALAASGSCPRIPEVPDAGTPQAGPDCPRCPAGWSCGADGGCTGGDPAHLVLDVKTLPYSAEVTLDCLPVVRETYVARSGIDSFYPATQVDFATPDGWTELVVHGDGSHWKVNGPVLAGSIPWRAVMGSVGTPLAWPAHPTSIDAPLVDGVLDLRTLGNDSGSGVPVSGEVLLAGAKFPGCSGIAGSVRLVSSISYTARGTCNGGSGWTFSLAVPAGTYDVWVDPPHEMYGASQQVRQGLVVDGPIGNLQLDLVEYPVSGTLTVNGAVPSCDELLIKPVNGSFLDSQFGGNCPGGGSLSFRLYTPPGTYRLGLLRFGAFAGDGFIYTPAFQVSGPVEASFDIATTDVTGTITSNGAPISATDCAQTMVRFEGAAGLRYGSVQCDGTGWTFSATVAPGDYQVRIENPSSRAMPTFSPSLATIAVGPGPLGGVQIDAPLVPVSGTVSRNGVSAAGKCDGYFVAFDANDADHLAGAAPIDCSTGAWSFRTLLYPATYETNVTGPGPSGIDDVAIVDPALVVAPAMAPLAFDLRTVDVSLVVTIDGKPWPGPCSGSLLFGRSMRDVSCNSAGLAYEGTVPAGMTPVRLEIGEIPRAYLMGMFSLSPPLDLH